MVVWSGLGCEGRGHPGRLGSAEIGRAGAQAAPELGLIADREGLREDPPGGPRSCRVSGPLPRSCISSAASSLLSLRSKGGSAASFSRTFLWQVTQSEVKLISLSWIGKATSLSAGRAGSHN